VTSTSSQIDKDVKEDLHEIMQYQEQTSLEIEKAIEPEFSEVVTDHQKAGQILVELAKSVKSEALILLPRDKSMVRLDRLQVFDHIIKASQENNNAAEVKIICPLSQINSHIVKRISDCAPNIKIINGDNSPYGMFIVDNDKLFRAELSKPNAEHLSEAIGYTIYSTSKASTNSFKSVFELLWAELILNEELKRADKMQKEFINIATHELRTPAQSILGYAELASADPKLCKDDKHGLIDAIYRNAIRLQRLTKDILDVAKIESGTFQLANEVFNLNNLVADVVLDIKKRIVTTQENKVSIIYKTGKGEVSDEGNTDTTIFVNVDKERITQVLYNLLENAVKFCKDNSTVSVVVWKQNRGDDEEVNNGKGKDRRQQQKQLIEEVIIKIQDTGAGIHPDILPRLFTKFATKSLTGTGLGLYISKSIVEAHGGKIWAQNNLDGNGATFAFSLPLVK
jgi:two-component system, OmpR family, sensor histidine kinase VicK